LPRCAPAAPRCKPLPNASMMISIPLSWGRRARTSARTSRSSRPKGARSTTRIDGGSVDKVIDFINVNRDRYLEELKALLAIPSISALPQHAPDVKRCAEWCADETRRIGPQNVRLIDIPGNPVVYGDSHT